MYVHQKEIRSSLHALDPVRENNENTEPSTRDRAFGLYLNNSTSSIDDYFNPERCSPTLYSRPFDPKCPLCHSPTVHFQRIYLNNSGSLLSRPARNSVREKLASEQLFTNTVDSKKKYQSIHGSDENSRHGGKHLRQQTEADQNLQANSPCSSYQHVSFLDHLAVICSLQHRTRLIQIQVNKLQSEQIRSTNPHHGLSQCTLNNKEENPESPHHRQPSVGATRSPTRKRRKTSFHS